MRRIIPLNDDWSFRLIKGEGSGEEADFQKLDLPHTWNNIDGQDGGDDYFRGHGLYLKTFPKPEGERAFIEFKGVGQSARVYLNDHFLGEHHGGYSTFRFEITEQLQARNVLKLDVDNTVNECVYPQTADFTFYGGIYRDVNLITTAREHFELLQDGGPGIRITPSLEKGGARVLVELFAQGGDEAGVEILGKTRRCPVEAGGARTEFVIEDPHLWNGLEDPYLYECKAVLLLKGEPKDEIACRFGIREFSIDPDKGFFLNGKSYPLRGVSKHQDRGGAGNAVRRENLEEDMDLILEVGANTVRLAHYQHDQYFYDLCDEKGLVVWAEIPFISRFMPEAEENTISQLRELISQNYNHPSIVCWGLSNEISIGGDAEDPLLLENHRRLKALAHAMDATRPTTMAHVFILDPHASLIDIPDIASYNLYYGWYVGEAKDNEAFLDRFHAEHPGHCIGLSEYGADANPRYHSSRPRKGDYTEEYQCLYHQHLLDMFETRPYLWATHVWNMFDFAADARKEGGNHGINQKGLVTIDRKLKKDAFYLYKAYWNKKEPFVHLSGRRFRDRCEKETVVRVYSNCPEISLYVDGTLFETKRGAKVFDFTLPLSGEHRIRAVSGSLQDEISIRRVPEPNPAYVVDGGDVINWFEADELDPACFSINDAMNEIMANPEAARIVESLLEKARAARGDMAERAMQNRQLQEVMGKMNLQTVLTLGSSVSHGEIKELNRQLQQIKKQTEEAKDYSIQSFERKHEKVICIDSDGTMIDAMNVKHDKCHGESFIDVFGLREHAPEIHRIWDSINLYEKSRGVNRFIAIVEMFKRIDGKYLDLDKEDLAAYCRWVEKGNLAHEGLVEEYKKNPNPLIGRILEWSDMLLKRIAALTPQDKPPFENGREALEYALDKCDIAIISSSNMAAIVEEWKAHGLLKYVDVITSQEVGSKGDCLKKMREKGYGKEDILMIGDAYPDVDAARANGVWYYPIITRQEGRSWQLFMDQFFDAFLEGGYGGCQEELLKAFEKNFETEESQA